MLEVWTSIENPAGTKRRPSYPTLVAHYGYIRGTIGNDGDHVDCFVKPNAHENYSGNVYIINQLNIDGSFDEHKCMIGYSTEATAMSAYLQNYERGWEQRVQSVASISARCTAQTLLDSFTAIIWFPSPTLENDTNLIL